MGRSIAAFARYWRTGFTGSELDSRAIGAMGPYRLWRGTGRPKRDAFRSNRISLIRRPLLGVPLKTTRFGSVFWRVKPLETASAFFGGSLSGAARKTQRPSRRR
jgi:hypothetical protein